MGAILVDGKHLAENICNELNNKIIKLEIKYKIVPGLAIVLVGEDTASQIYVRTKLRKAKEIGIKSFEYFLPNSITEDILINILEELNANNEVNGIILQLPLPKHIDQHKVINTISYLKDVDGFTVQNIGLLNSWQDCLEPSTPHGIIALIKNYLGEDIAGKKVVVIGRSIIVGRPLTSILIRESCTVTLLHSKSVNIENECKNADILISAVGQRNIVTANLVKKGAFVIDVGINRINDKVVGDVDFASVSKVAGYITPVQGGVGPMTVACMLENTLKALCMQKGINYDDLI